MLFGCLFSLFAYLFISFLDVPLFVQFIYLFSELVVDGEVLPYVKADIIWKKWIKLSLGFFLGFPGE